MTYFDRNNELLWSFGPLFKLNILFDLLLHGYGLSDNSQEFYFYNNRYAAGAQVYPTGLDLYYDMYSMPGFTEYCLDWLVSLGYALISPLTLLIPINLWTYMVESPSSSYDGEWIEALTKYWSPFSLLILPYCKINGCPLENGWTDGIH